RADLLLRDYENQQISFDMSKDYLRKRFIRCWRLVDEIDRRIKELESDDIMKKMDNEFVTTSLAELDQLKERAEKMASLDHLSKEGMENIRRKFADEDQPWILGRKKCQDYRISGVLAASCRQHLDDEQDESKSESSEISAKGDTTSDRISSKSNSTEHQRADE
ncbi:MAG TPA: hypothetical protein VEL47_03645, partial [Myxococcota bacterium]|nr:hypothetical protein [Myxococcota bacterium]